MALLCWKSKYLIYGLITIIRFISASECQSGWVYSPVSSSCIGMFLEPRITFYNAATRCIRNNSRLASIKSSIEQSFIADILKENHVLGSGWKGFWTAGFDLLEEGMFHWFMDDIAWPLSIKWTPNNPSNFGNYEDCVMIRTTSSNYGELNDAPCFALHIVQGYLCKYNLDVRKCKEGWIYNGETDTCYKYEMESPETWNDARKKCSDTGGILATIVSKSEQLFMKVFVADTDVKGAWVGAHDMQEDGLFQWIDETTWIQGLWAPDQPNNWNGKQNCAMIAVNANPNALGLIQGDVCADKYPYICAIKKLSTTTTTSTFTTIFTTPPAPPSLSTTTVTKNPKTVSQGECDDGTYGQNCQSNCTGHCNNNVPCRKTDGRCPDGCAPGYTGEKCSEKCSEGSWGENCLIPCGKCKSGSCDRYNGVCKGSCQPGYKATLYCYEECDIGWYGINCTGQCSPDCTDLSLCRKSDGYCVTETTTATTTVIAGVGATAIVVIILGVLAVIWYLRRTRNGNVKKKENRANRGVAMSDISSEGRTSGVNSTDRTGNTYDSLQGRKADEHHYELSD